MEMSINQYFELKKEFYNNVLAYLEEDESSIYDFEKIIESIKNQDIQTEKEELEHFIQLLLNLSNHHHRDLSFFTKIEQIFDNIKNDIKREMTNSEIFNIFQNNKRLLLILYEKEIITFDENILKIIKEKKEPNETRYYDFFLPEIKKINDNETKQIEDDMIKRDPNIFVNFEEKRKIGENDSYICSLIRQDSVEEFISYINRNNISFQSIINPSIFETNAFLNSKNAILIEYASFFGSIQIFQFLRMNKVDLSLSLWLYAIHSKNAELIHLLEENQVKPDDKTNEELLFESIKCHHNDIAKYIENNLMNPNNENSNLMEKIAHCSFRYANYSYIPTDFNQNYVFFYWCKYNYIKIVNDYLSMKNEEISNYTTINKAASENRIDIIYYLLQKQKKIKPEDFKSCKELTLLVIPPCIKTIINCSFMGCSKLTQISIPSTVTSIGNYSFRGCTSLVEVTIPPSVTSIGKGSFESCLSMEEITLPYSIESIGIGAFNNCSLLKEITIPHLVTMIQNDTFKECSLLNKISLPSSITFIGENSFEKCSSLKQISIPQSVSYIGKTAFCECSSLREISIPSNVTSLQDFTFKGCTSLVRISIPQYLMSIGIYCFNMCSSLHEISIPEKVTSIGERAFAGCSSLIHFTIPPSLTSIEFDTFGDCSSLTNIVIPQSVKSIDKWAFFGCSSLTHVSIPSSITEIEESVFMGCSSLVQINLPSSITKIEMNAFRECISLTQILIPNSVTFIGKGAFKDCSSLIQLSIPKSVTSIGENAFENCTSLIHLTISSNFDVSLLGINSNTQIDRI